MKRLSDKELEKLAMKISEAKLRNITIRHLGLTAEQVESMSDENIRDRTNFKQQILIKWRNMNSSEGNVRQVCNVHADYARFYCTSLTVLTAL